MSRDMPRLGELLRHILEAIARIQMYTADVDKESFLDSAMVQDAVLRNLEIVGEACHSVEARFPEFAGQHPHVPWAAAYQMRNAIAHGYFVVDLDIVWTTIQADLPELKEKILRLLEGLR
ncbi:DUF86 domain-containing protein [uncultured Rhodospira sp.]|uniref:HepT-like ribonuclease domain-containing protein n=1 Tax=uncultured Rhodospira sp. TaxID=1936189 RepID=UPI0026037CB2|nr:DUF86 domain-containing protein [uncultured Rhodospira sp.]